MALRRIPLHRSLNRASLLMGGERKLVLFTLLIAVAVGFVGLRPIFMALALAFWLVCMALLRMMAKADPYMSEVYQRYARYQPYYPPFSRPYCED